MDDFIISIGGLLIAVAYFCLGRLWGCVKEKSLRIVIIKLEHDTARALNREPRKVDEVIQHYKKKG